MKFSSGHRIFFQKVIRSEPMVRLISVNIIFRFQNILMSISDSNEFFVTRAGKKVEFEKLNFFSLQREKLPDFSLIQNGLYMEFFQDLGMYDHLHVQEIQIHMQVHLIRAHRRHRNCKHQAQKIMISAVFWLCLIIAKKQ